jgi:hypothetical protein
VTETYPQPTGAPNARYGAHSSGEYPPRIAFLSSSAFSTVFISISIVLPEEVTVTLRLPSPAFSTVTDEMDLIGMTSLWVLRHGLSRPPSSELDAVGEHLDFTSHLADSALH